jgi:hypothetical protein
MRYEEKNQHIGRIARSYLVDARRRYRSLIDIRQGLEHIMGDDLSHMFIESENGELSLLVSEAMGRQASWHETHLGFEKIIEQRTYAADSSIRARMLLSIRKTKKRIGKLSRLFRDYFRQHGIDIRAKRFACGIMFSLGMAERRMRTMSYAHHFSAYDMESKMPAGADMLISRVIMSSPTLAYYIGRSFDESDRTIRLTAPEDSSIYRRFDDFIRETRVIKDPYLKPSASEFWKKMQ